MGKGKTDEDPAVMIFKVSSTAKVHECLLPKLMRLLDQEERTDELAQLEKMLKKRHK